MLKVTILHTDFRIYWPARLRSLNNLLCKHDILLNVVEIAGLGSHYDFAEKKEEQNIIWKILFPSDKMESLKIRKIRKSVLDILDKLNPDILIAGAIAFPSGALAVQWAQKKHKRVIIFDDAQIEHVQRNTFVNYIKQAVYHGVDAMFYPSCAWEKTGLYWNFKKEDLFYGLDVVDNAFWRKQVEFQSDLPSKYFLCVGRQIPKKNLKNVLIAYNMYRHKLGDAYKLLIVGNGEEHKNLVDYVIEERLDKFVVFKTFVQQQELIGLYRQAQALIIASRLGETWGLVINEAMASGLPIICSTQCGAASTLVKDKINGYVFYPNDVYDLEEKLINFHQLSFVEKERMSKNSSIIIDKWDIDRFSTSLYKAILYVKSKKRRNLSWIDCLIINLWNGRYRPV